MSKRVGSFVLKCISLHEIFLLVLATAAFGFIVGGANFVSAYPDTFLVNLGDLDNRNARPSN